MWLGCVWPHRRPLVRAARYDGVFPVSHEASLTGADVRAILETVDVHRAAGAGPFDLVVVNHERPDAERLAELERRGRHLVAAGLRRAPAAVRRAGRRGGRPARVSHSPTAKRTSSGIPNSPLSLASGGCHPGSALR